MSTTEHSSAGVQSAWRFPPSVAVGRVLGGRWTVVRALGAGGIATVYEAVHRNGRRVAVKVLHPELAHSPSIRRRFQSEGYAANRVQHPNVVAVLDDGEEPDGTVYLVMELLAGRSLAAYLSDGTEFTVNCVASIGIAVLDILAVAHDSAVIHRDIKPANVFRTLEGQIKLLDFGAARVGESAVESAITHSGASVGTPAFMAPEQAAGRTQEVDALTDIWAVGATMFQLLTRQLVHETRESSGSAVFVAATAPAPSLRSVAPHMPAAIADVIDRALAFQRLERWPNARAMRLALESAYPNAALEAAIDRPHPETEPEVALYYPSSTASVSRRPSTTAGWALLGVVAVGVSFAAWRTITTGHAHRTTISRASGVTAQREAESHARASSNDATTPGSASASLAASTVSALATPAPVIRAFPGPINSSRPKSSLRRQPLPPPIESEEALLEHRK